MPTIITDDDAPLATEAEAAAAQAIKAQFGELCSAGKNLANSDVLLAEDILTLLGDATAVLQNTRRSITPGTVPALAIGSITPAGSLGSGTTGDTTTSTEDEDALTVFRALARDLGFADLTVLAANMARTYAPVVDLPTDAEKRDCLDRMVKARDGEMVPKDDLAQAEAKLRNAEDPTFVGSPAHEASVALSELRAMTGLRDGLQVQLDNMQDEDHTGSLAQQVKVLTASVTPWANAWQGAHEAYLATQPLAHAGLTALVDISSEVARNGRLKKAVGGSNLSASLKSALGA